MEKGEGEGVAGDLVGMDWERTILLSHAPTERPGNEAVTWYTLSVR